MDKLTEINIDLQMALKRLAEKDYASVQLFVMSALRNVNAAQQSAQSDETCESCKLQFTSSCPSLLGKRCQYYQSRR